MRFFTLLVLTAFVQYSFAQSEPFGFSLPIEQLQHLPVSELATFNHDRLLEEDTRIENEGGRTNIGRIIPVALNEQTVGSWTMLDNGDRVWQYRFRTAGAKGVCVYFDGLYIPQGAVMFMYSMDRKTFVGPFTMDDCNAHGNFMMGEVLGEEALLEYYEPAGVVGVPSIGIQSVAHMYRYVYDYSTEEANDNSRASDYCEVDVNCPEGTPWAEQRDAVVRLLINDGTSQGLCSGSIINTTARDCRKYLLTALHCGIGVSDSEWLLCNVRFKYQRSGCATGTAPNSSRTGVHHLADANDNGGDSGSDFLLLEIEDDIPASYNVFFAGWDARANTPADVVGIHHPAGDVKKISSSTNIVSGTWSAPGNHWRVTWMATETNYGVTEGGSSGSPIFNENKRIVGQLTGGGSFCDTPTSPDFYGKMDKSWDDNPNTADQKLKVWLDPNNTGELFMDGAYADPNNATQPCMPTSVTEQTLEFTDVQIFPSIADESLSIRSSQYRSLIEYRIFNAQGAWIASAPVRAEREQFSCANLPSGVYFITFEAENGAHLTKKFVVEHK
jgi:Trypsin-like peptidase domain/Secretion system C-terminal sorting domain